MDWQNAILLFVTLIISLTVHEAAHAFVAMLGGDQTAYRTGQVTLNPLPHIRREPFGTLVLPILSLLSTNGSSCFGFAHAPINVLWAQRNPGKAAVMSAAGPLANVLLAAIAFGVLWYIGQPDGGSEVAIRRIAGTFLLLNLILAIFNLIPLPPLDGAGVVKGLFQPARALMELLERVPYMFIVTFVIANQLVPYVVIPAFRTVNHWLPYPYRW